MTHLWICAGLEPTGRAGVLADLETAHALGATAGAVVSALTAQGLRFLTRPTPAALLEVQLASLDRADAGKVGVVPNQRSMRLIEARFTGRPWVVDPVVVSSRGERLSSLVARDYLALAGPEVVISPNAVEAGWLFGGGPLASVEDLAAAARAFVALGFGGAVVKGGHLRGKVVDVVCDARGRVSRLARSRLPRRRGHRGTGCRHATALAVGLGSGADLLRAARGAQRWVGRYLAGPEVPSR